MLRHRVNRGWTFWKEGQEEKKRVLDLPHDAMLEEKRDPEMEAGSATGYYPGGRYYYAKTLYGLEEWEDKSLILEFEGVYMDSTVYLNGEKAGGRRYGYSNFFVDLTGKLRIGQQNELRVEVDNSHTPNSRWYSGSGIYRSVNLWIGGKIHFPPEGIRAETASLEPPAVRVQAEVDRNEDLEIDWEVYDRGKLAASGQGRSAEIRIPGGKPWSAEEPNLYELKAVLKSRGAVQDEAAVTFGLRTLSWNSREGFLVNGRSVKLKGGCIHHDNGPLGACSYEKAEYRRVRRLKEFGYNAVRYAHNPAGKDFLEACDHLGMYVLEETFDQWEISKNPYDYASCFDTEWKKDIGALVAKDYNHPSVILYCIGNEISDTGLPQGAELAEMLNSELHRLDATRPTTIAINPMLSVLASRQAEDQKEKKNQEKIAGSQEFNEMVAQIGRMMSSIHPRELEGLIGGCESAVDIAGYNYGQSFYEGTHELVPERVILSTETYPSQMADNWKTVLEHPYVIGDFMWTAWDYLGESGVGLPVYGVSEAPFSKPYPCRSAYCGSFDLTGYPESQAYCAAVIWGCYDRPYLCVRPVSHSGEPCTLGFWRLTDALPSWTWPGQEGKDAEVVVFSGGDSVELFQDGVSLGRKTVEDWRCSFHAVYRPGRLEAVQYDSSGREMARGELATEGEETELVLQPEDREIRADGLDLAYVDILLTDGAGKLKLSEERRVRIRVEGSGYLVALGSGNPVSEESFRSDACRTWHGRELAVVRSDGTRGRIRITAEAEGGLSEAVEIEAV